MTSGSPAPNPPALPDDEPEHIVLHARDVDFDWSRMDLHWIPGDPFATHTINVLHLLLPEGERWFLKAPPPEGGVFPPGLAASRP